MQSKIKDLVKKLRTFIYFSCDFIQPSPVGDVPLYCYKECNLFQNEGVHNFLELKTNHRFQEDNRWGNLQRYQSNGLTEEDVQIINKRVILEQNNLTENEIPHDATYVVKLNSYRCAINDAIFANHLAETCSKDIHVDPPKHTICIKASEKFI